MSCSLKTALSVARNNSRTTKTTWIVLSEEHGYTAEETSNYIPYRVVASFRNGRKINNDSLKKLAVACGNHPYEDGE